MSSSEIAFLALGLVLGGALGAAFLAAVRAWPAPRREVRLTITPNSIAARRAVTLADATPARERPSPPGSPDDAAWPDRADGTGAEPSGGSPETSVVASPLRTRVPSAPARVPLTAVAVTIGGGHPVGGPGLPRPTARHGPEHEGVRGSLASSAAAVAVAAGPAPTTAGQDAAAWPDAAGAPAYLRAITVLDVGRPAPEQVVRLRPPAADPRPSLADAAVGIPIARAEGPRRPTGEWSGASPQAPASAAGAVDPCAAARITAEERCAAAAGARERARVAADAMRDAQRAIDTLRERIERAREASDPRGIAAEKAGLHAAFREANAKAATPEEAEAAARRWLSGIDRVNTEARAGLRVVAEGTAELREILPDLQRRGVEADAARITAEGTGQECRAAREELARCEELAVASARLAAATTEQEPHPFAGVWPTGSDLTPPRPASGDQAEALAGLPAVVRMLRGDRVSRDRVVAALAGGDPSSVATWQLRLSALVDAIVARAIEAGYLDLPDGNPFWALFDARERREIVVALSSLGYRFDGLGGFADGRVPATRDLSLAVGFAGLDPMRIRIWPRDVEIRVLYAGASVAAAEWLTDEADDLALGTVIDALGHRATDLGELWGAWGRIRSLLLTSD